MDYNKAKEWYNIAKQQDNILAIEILERQFPELKESEDESTRKWIIRYLENRVLNTSIFEEKESCQTAIKWLEKQCEKKPAWSEEDEENILFLTSIIEECFKDKEKITLCGDTVCANFTKEDVIDRLKSLRPQSHWKPSEEQMNALDDVISSRDIKYDVLSELWVQLKKLKE